MGIFCLETANNTQMNDICYKTGKDGSGVFTSMNEEDYEYLVRYYQTANIDLYNLLEDIEKRIPQWLDELITKY